MTARSTRLQPAVEQAQRREQDALQRLAGQQRRTAYVQQQLDDLERYRREYSLSAGGLTVSALLNRQQFVDRIDQAITQQKREVERQRRVTETARVQWLQTHARERALDSVVERFRTQEQQSEQRQEQAEMDEHTQNRRRAAGFF
ncbi:flagellar export protein FliJ [Rhodanobacter sp. MP7CTX1]|uniref:flagellar export protein FliJ n=1 Tax=Rhodanobacter sp. MP7CTX1 TaxID=2723084 RepID=UPI001622B4F4|nr:flagellar export protein FliJ [Rhodanobacter sp. MP7CTX1]MBB6186247.1 flagellar FliJ protein [Rhodanobacter sp. MP7CTX1]